MKKLILILLIIVVGAYCNTPLQAQGADGLPDITALPPVSQLEKTLSLPMDPDMGVLEVYKYSDNNRDTYVFRNTAYAPIEVKVELLPQSQNVYSIIPDAIRVPAQETVAAFQIGQKDSGYWDYRYLIPKFRIGYSLNTHTGGGDYLLPYPNGKSYAVLQGEEGGFSHYGEYVYSVDFDMPEGSEITAIRDGVVIFVKQDSNVHGLNRKYYKDKGNYIWIMHDDGSVANYYHLKQNGATVKIGDPVKAGDLIGYSGNTGFSNKPHLHLQVTLFKGFAGSENMPIRFKGINGALIQGERYTNGE